MLTSEQSTDTVMAGITVDNSLPPLSVTTWNILNPCIDPAKMFPGISKDIWEMPSRRPIIRSRLESLASDVLLLQEVSFAELHALLHEGSAPMSSSYDSHFVPERVQLRPVDLQSNPDDAAAMDMRGVAILWRKGVLTAIQCFCETLEESTSNPAAFVKARVVAWGDEVLFASKHLDARGCPPAVHRCAEELLEVTKRAAAAAGPEPSVVIFGGDCNLTNSAPAMAAMPGHGFHLASGNQGVSSCFSAITSARFDHIFIKGPWVAETTNIPECPERHCCSLTPCLHQLQVGNDLLGLSRPPVPGCWRRALGILLLPAWLLGVVCCFLVPMPLSMKRCRWALEEWGSDHMPVTVIFRKPRSRIRQRE